jgi:acetyl esterase/lipase
MTQSLSFYITMWVIKLKGFKKIFNESPIDYMLLRKNDVLFPKNRSFKSKNVHTFQIADTQITEVKNKVNSNKLLLFIHGGAYISGPAQHHWESVRALAEQTNYTIWLCNYPKAPTFKIEAIAQNIDAVYAFALKTTSTENICLLGDSVGGSIILALTQRLIIQKQFVPSKLILISPVVDATFENPAIDNIEKKDPMLSKKGILSAKKMCLTDGNLKNETISPIFGNFKGFPKTFLFVAENDICYPDQIILSNHLKNEQVEHTTIVGKAMPHIWPLLPFMKEANIAFQQIITILNKPD